MDACDENIGKTGTEPYSSTYPSTSSSDSPFSQPSSSDSSGSVGSAGMCGLPAAMIGLVLGILILSRKSKE
jgi:hypothetical protein